MIVLKNQQNIFKLEVLNYEFHNSDFKEDLNWLDVRIYAEDKINRWTAQGPFLQTIDVISLLEWFRMIESNSDKVEKRLNFLEHELSFEVIENKTIVVNLDFTFHPKGTDYDYDRDTEYRLYFDLNRIDLKKDLIPNLERLTLEFPVRMSENFKS